MKKGFTLAEIMIVITCMALFVAFTIPAVAKYMLDSKFKTSYKKAYNAMSSLISSEHLRGQVPASGSTQGAASVFYSLLNNLAIKGFSPQSALDDGQISTLASYKTAVKFKDATGATVTFGAGDAIDALEDWTQTPSPWILSEDNIAYSVIAHSNTSCFTREKLNSLNNAADLANNACAIIVVDVNSVDNGPNIIEPQVKTGIDIDKKMQVLTGDRFYIYVGTNGISAGSKTKIISGRIMAGLD